MNATRTQARRTDAALVVGNVLWNAAASLFGSVIAFLLVPFLLHRLGDAAYGVWALVGSVFAMTVVAAAVSYYLVEKPALRLKR